MNSLAVIGSLGMDLLKMYDKEIGKGKAKKDVTMYVTEVYATRLQRMDPKPKGATEHDAGEPEGEAVPF